MTKHLGGFHYACLGFKLILQPRLRHFIWIPLCLNFFLWLLLLGLSLSYFSTLTNDLSASWPHWLSSLLPILWLVVFVLFYLMSSYTFVTMANVVGAPFNSQLSAAVEEVIEGQKPQSEGLLYTLKDLPRCAGRQMLIVLYYLPRALILLALSFVPGLQLLTTPLIFIFNGWFMALQALDYPSDIHHIPFKDLKARLRRRPFLGLSFGLSLLFFSFIPLLNLFLVPAAVAGATQLWLEELKPKN